MAHVAEWKFKEVEELTNLITSNKVIGVAKIGGIPSLQMQQMRRNLQGIAFARCSKNSLISRALDNAEKKVKGISDLKKEIIGQTAIITTDMNPFKLYNKIKETKTMAPAKGGETASQDIEIKAGDTPFKPGPIVGELQKAGFPAAIQEGKVVMKSDKTIVTKGEKITKDVAQMLTRLEIFPIKIGMSLNAIFENGSIYKPEILDVDIEDFICRMIKASNSAFSLAVESSWINNFTIKTLLNKAYINTFTVAIKNDILTKKTTMYMISEAHRSMLSLSSHTKGVIN